MFVYFPCASLLKEVVRARSLRLFSPPVKILLPLVTSAAPGHFRIRAVQLTNVDQRFLIGLCCRTFSWWVALAAPLSCTGRPAADPLLVFLLPPLHWIIPSCGGFFWISARIIFLFCWVFFSSLSLISASAFLLLISAGLGWVFRLLRCSLSFP